MTRVVTWCGYLVVACAVLLVTTTARADEKDEGKGKGKDEKPVSRSTPPTSSRHTRRTIRSRPPKVSR